MDRLLSMRVFQQVIDEGGFAAAARALNMSPASVTRLVTDLEQHLGARLIQRTTRKISLTEAGSAYLLRVRSIMHSGVERHAACAVVCRHCQLRAGPRHCAVARTTPQGGD
jgi:DNA-binding transcriptional LysR family regulator